MSGGGSGLCCHGCIKGTRTAGGGTGPPGAPHDGPVAGMSAADVAGSPTPFGSTRWPGVTFTGGCGGGIGGTVGTLYTGPPGAYGSFAAPTGVGDGPTPKEPIALPSDCGCPSQGGGAQLPKFDGGGCGGGATGGAGGEDTETAHGFSCAGIVGITEASVGL